MNGGLISGESFSLLEAMSAVEYMDKRNDPYMELSRVASEQWIGLY